MTKKEIMFTGGNLPEIYEAVKDFVTEFNEFENPSIEIEHNGNDMPIHIGDVVHVEEGIITVRKGQMTKKQQAIAAIYKLAEWLQREDVSERVMSDIQAVDTGDYGRTKVYRFGNRVVTGDEMFVGVEITIEDRNHEGN